MRIIIRILGLVILLVSTRLIWGVGSISGIARKLEPSLVAQCTRIDIAPGTEDIAIDHRTGTVFIGAGDRRQWFEGTQRTEPQQGRNGIYAFDPQDPSSLKKVSPDNMDDFLPHGISLWHGAKNSDGQQERRLFVVNHPSDGRELIELFDIAPDNTLTHLDSIEFAQMYSPNDIYAVGPRQFYATNDQKFDNGAMALLETYLTLPISNVVYYDGKEGHIVAKGLVYANGINGSLDGNTVFVAEALGQKIRIFDRDPASGALKRVGKIKTNMVPDNIDIDTDNNIWVAGHPKGFAFQAHAQDAKAVAPSQVVRINPKSKKQSIVFTSTNGELNASSIGAVDRGQLYVGAVFDGHILSCPLDKK